MVGLMLHVDAEQVLVAALRVQLGLSAAAGAVGVRLYGMGEMV